MRTTIELRDDQRARLLELAARRGEKGFSALVQEAVERYLQAEDSRRECVQRALKVGGSLDDKGADELERSVRAIRGNWR